MNCRLKSMLAAVLLFSAPFAHAVQAQAPSEDNLHPLSEDNLGAMTEDGTRTTQQPQNPAAHAGAGSTVGQPGSGSAAAAGLATELFVQALAGAPLLPAAQNPLLGRWHTTGAKVGTDLNSIGPLGTMSTGIMSGGCDSMFGKGVTFKPASFERVASDGRTQVLQPVEYRGRGATIAVLLKGTGTEPTIMRMTDPDHAVSAFGCTLQRDQTDEERRLASNATLRFQVGLSGPGGFTPLVNAALWVMLQDPQASYTAAGLVLPPDVPFLAKLASDCRSPPVCQGEIVATVKGALGRVMTDAQGQAQTPPIRAGHYYVVGVSNINGKPLIWVQPVDLQPGVNALTLDQHNGRSPGQ